MKEGSTDSPKIVACKINGFRPFGHTFEKPLGNKISKKKFLLGFFDPDDLAWHQMEVFTNKRKRAFGTLSSFLRASKIGPSFNIVDAIFYFSHLRYIVKKDGQDFSFSGKMKNLLCNSG